MFQSKNRATGVQVEQLERRTLRHSKELRELWGLIAKLRGEVDVLRQLVLPAPIAASPSVAMTPEDLLALERMATGGANQIEADSE